MKTFITLALAIEGAFAFGNVKEQLEERGQPSQKCRVSQKCEDAAKVVDTITNHEIDYNPQKPTPAQEISKARTNCGAQGPCVVFEPAGTSQYVSTTGKHKYKAPRQDQIRGPCPGLNAAANHGYLKRSGVQTLISTVGGLGQAYGMDADLAGFLAAYAIAIDGDVATQTWSIGGPQPFPNVAGLLGRPQGISYAHNKYEGDASITRCDAYMNDGDAHTSSVTRFASAWKACNTGPRKLCTMDDWSRDFTKKTLASIRTNPYYFAPLFSTTLVSPAAYNFVVNMMSNHSKEEPNGFLTREVFQTFFAMDGDYPNFTYRPGQERIPDNWWRRPMLGPTTEYTAVEGVFGDLAAEFAAYPKSFRFGGNTNGTDTYTGIDIEDATGGVFNAKGLQDKDNLACFALQNIQQGLPDALHGGVNDLASATSFLTPFFKAAFPLNNCPQLQKLNDNTFNKYPGHSYKPSAKDATNC